ncbi:hypothetical protein L2E82_04560 [Cichorium intybus]|uniref:Uncharacterized protein n=1 Tax=Cichorium intybus TaxID=13427 RepID=A0ACB9H5L5_CICIN|nr:hypothetical protein L2E82_04560 [Cichorium intybus]
MDHFRTIINKNSSHPSKNSREKSAVHEDKKEQEITARNSATHQQKVDAIKNIIVDTNIQKENENLKYLKKLMEVYGEVMDPLHASSQVIQSEEQFDDEVQLPQVVPKGTAKNRAKKSSSSTVSEKVDVSVPSVRWELMNEAFSASCFM